MKFLFIILMLSTFVFAKSSGVRGYAKKNGTYVKPHWKSSSNSTKLDNYSNKGNANPFNGKKGNKK